MAELFCFETSAARREEKKYGAFVNYSSDNSDSSSADSDISIAEPDFGILFDVDGVLARGSAALAPAVKAIEKLKDADGQLRVPCAFVTNACNRTHDKAKQIAGWFNLEVSCDQVIHAPTPVKLLRQFHDQHVLVIGQEHRLEIAKDLGFSNLCTLDDVKEAYPLLDMVDHENRKVVARGYKENNDFPKIEAVLLLAEPTHWEANLQLLMDLLLTEGKPTKAPADPKRVPQLPVIACNMDLQFMAEACIPRFGHGAFLVCLEALYRKITGKDLEYSTLVGKPCEITYRFAEHTISKVAKTMGIRKPIKRLYFIGDNPNVDIYGANLYDRYLQKVWNNKKNGNDVTTQQGLPSSRHIPSNVDLHEQTVERCHSLLVGTGVYQHKPEVTEMDDDNEKTYHGHRDINNEPHLSQPSKFVQDVDVGIQHILEVENCITA
ncbi:haloacid dehalogenase-like hydrolase domain-containing 5 isoform X1 [Haliotis cracherodii]|uniref:haloacid dehalogenase-like hydrolase domain-containing 5 isoform X1 n=1 Tax=Haliotis cracherodii TaxID=6455 RepID=UPI0039E7A8DF